MLRQHRVAALAGICCLASLAGAVRPAAAGAVRVVAVGDIACDPGNPSYNDGAGTATDCRQRATSDLALALQPEAVLLLGDLQYDDGKLAKFQASFHPSWGRLKGIAHPAPGNHEYQTAGAAGYYDYFGAAAGPRGKGYYSFDLAGWHAAALNSNCAAVGGCGPGSPQLAWLAADLAAAHRTCTLAFWHHPRFSSSLGHGSDANYRAFWETLQQAEADLVLVGHDHDYERFGPQDGGGAEDRAGGIRSLVVGTGGRVHYAFGAALPNSEMRLTGRFGVLLLSLYPNGYLFRFVTTDQRTEDQGGALCHRAWAGPTTPDFHALKGCRAVSTRRSEGPALRQARDFRLAGVCGVPDDAVAVAVRVTAFQSTSRGGITVYPAGEQPPGATTLGFLRGRTATTDLLLPLGANGEVTIAPALLLAGAAVQVLVDVFGYFR